MELGMKTRDGSRIRICPCKIQNFKCLGLFEFRLFNAGGLSYRDPNTILHVARRRFHEILNPKIEYHFFRAFGRILPSELIDERNVSNGRL